MNIRVNPTFCFLALDRSSILIAGPGATGGDNCVRYALRYALDYGLLTFPKRITATPSTALSSFPYLIRVLGQKCFNSIQQSQCLLHPLTSEQALNLILQGRLWQAVNFPLSHYKHTV